MFAVELNGLNETSARLDGLPAILAAALTAKARELAAALADRVKTDKLAGGVLSARSGALQASIGASVTADGDGIVASVGSTGDAKYAAIQEYGGTTAAHEILPVKARALAFIAGGALRFAHKVQHPGSVIPERPYLRSALEEMGDEITAELANAASETLERA